MIENLESTSIAVVVGSVVGAIVSTIIKTHNLKKVLKEEIVDPDIMRLDKEIQDIKNNFKEELSRMSEENNKLSIKIDRNFDGLNKKIDTNAKEVAKIQGMVTVMFNSMKQSFYEQQ